jgi:pimeloyl-ACP methyl ester carboxylesterase
MAARALSINSTNVRNTLEFAWHRLALAVASALAPERAVARAARLFATPPRHAHTRREIELLRTGRGFVVHVGLVRLAAWRFGNEDRPAVVFSHGWGGRGAQFRHFVAPLVEAGYQVVLFDHEGHGLSEGRESSLIHFVKSLEAVVADVERGGSGVAAVVGHSLGAAAVGAYLNATKRATHAVLIAPPTSIERYSYYFARRLGIPERIRAAMQQRFERRFGRRWQEFELPHSVAQARAPALVLHDADDNEVAHASGESLARAWPGARLVTTRGLGHRGVLRDAAVVRDTLDFIAERTVFAPPAARGAATFGQPAALV